jgi:hypothetical protein
VRLAHPEHHRQKDTLAGLGEAPCDQDAFLGPVVADSEKGGVHEQRRQVEVVEVAAPERRKALAQLAADPGRSRLRQLAQPGLLAQRLDIAHREAAHERADHHRLQRLRAQQLRAAREQLGDERLGRLPDLRDLDRELPLRRLDPARPEAVA